MKRCCGLAMPTPPDRRDGAGPAGRPHGHLTVGYIIAALMMLVALQWLASVASPVTSIPYSQFDTLVTQRQVAEVTVGQSTIQGVLKTPLKDGATHFTTDRVDPALAAKLAVDRAESMVSNQMTPAVQEAMINNFVQSLQGRPN